MEGLNKVLDLLNKELTNFGEYILALNDLPELLQSATMNIGADFPPDVPKGTNRWQLFLTDKLIDVRNQFQNAVTLASGAPTPATVQQAEEWAELAYQAIQRMEQWIEKGAAWVHRWTTLDVSRYLRKAQAHGRIRLIKKRKASEESQRKPKSRKREWEDIPRSQAEAQQQLQSAAAAIARQHPLPQTSFDELLQIAGIPLEYSVPERKAEVKETREEHDAREALIAHAQLATPIAAIMTPEAIEEWYVQGVLQSIR